MLRLRASVGFNWQSRGSPFLHLPSSIMPSDGNSPNPAHDAESTSAMRRARKRATDRKSQRNHRERQRAYVRELERTVAALNSSVSTDERVAALLAENAKFRKRCEVLASQLNRIRAVAAETHERTTSEPSTEPAAGTPSLPPFDALDGVIDLSGDCGNAAYNEDAVDNADMVPPLSLDSAPDCSGGAVDFFTDAVLFDLDAQDTPEVSNVPTEPLFQTDLTLFPEASPGLPRYSPPQGPDRMIWAMLEEARTEHLAGKFDTSEPSLRRLLADGPVDALSFRLLQYIKAYGAMPMHWLLATFWVQYLFLRVS